MCPSYLGSGGRCRDGAMARPWWWTRWQRGFVPAPPFHLLSPLGGRAGFPSGSPCPSLCRSLSSSCQKASATAASSAPSPKPKSPSGQHPLLSSSTSQGTLNPLQKNKTKKTHWFLISSDFFIFHHLVIPSYFNLLLSYQKFTNETMVLKIKEGKHEFWLVFSLLK